MNCKTVGLCASLALCGCVRHVYPYNHKTRAYEKDTYAAPDAARSPGSLWSEGAVNLFEDAKARRIGDILTVDISEAADATRAASTQTQRTADVDFGISAFWTAMQSLAVQHPDLDPNAIIAASSQAAFSGAGNTSRTGTLSATLPVRIKDRLPNGDFYVEGNKVLLLNEEESFLYISGVVRSVDIAPDNSVSSSVLADVELEYTGRGVLSESENPGWLMRLLNYIWPF
jgi:flagellar L-ring protein FlgH